MRGSDLGKSRRSAQPLSRKADVAPCAEVTIRSVNINAVSADPLRIASIFQLILLRLRNHIFGLIAGIRANPVKRGKSVADGNTKLGAMLHRNSRLATITYL